MRSTLFVVANLAITLGYLYLSVFVVPRVSMHLLRTRIGGAGFFLLCGLHHLEGVAHVLFELDEPVRHVMLATHMLLIDIPQAICVWMFVTGLYIELVREGPADSQRPKK